MQTYTVQITRKSAQHVVATVRDVHLTLGAHREDATAGLNPVETLLSAMGACLLTALQMVAELSQVPIEGMALRVTGTRQDKPPLLVSATYQLTLQTPVAEEGSCAWWKPPSATAALAFPISETVTRQQTPMSGGG